MNSLEQKRVDQLAREIIYHKGLYYSGNPELSDLAYDQLEDELRRLCPDHPVLEVVGGMLSADLPKRNHRVPMLSLAKTYSREELLKWSDQKQLMATLKLDGVSVSLIYENSRLKLAKTRGNGRVGEDVTVKLMWMPEVPKVLNLQSIDPEQVIEVRGECLCSQENFVPLMAEMEKMNLPKPSHARNIVAGVLGRKQHYQLARYFHFVAFSALGEDGRSLFSSESEKFQWLERQKFTLPVHQQVRGEKSIEQFLAVAEKYMEQGEFGIDGVVFTFEDTAIHHEMGETSHHPRYKMSFKWQGLTAESVIDEIHWATSRLGVVTPVALIQPVQLSGANISNVTLHNASHVRSFNLASGDRIEIVRSGEVIPKFLKIVKKGSKDHQWPQNCPSCRQSLQFDGVRLICSNLTQCPAQQMGGLINWVKAVGIDDLSEKRIAPLVEQGLLRSPSDFYRLQVEDFLKMPATRQKLAEKLYRNIQKTTQPSLVAFLTGLGIAQAGPNTWELICSEHPNLKSILSLKVHDLTPIKGLAEKLAEALVTGLEQKKALIEDLIAVGVEPQAYQSQAPGTDQGQGALKGQVLVLTGAMKRPRSEYAKWIAKEGGKTSESVSQKITALVCSDLNSTSSKMLKARKLGIEILSEEELLKLLVASGNREQ